MIDRDQVTSEFVTSLVRVAYIADRDDLQKEGHRIADRTALEGVDRERFVIAIEEVIEVVLDGAKNHARKRKLN